VGKKLNLFENMKCAFGSKYYTYDRTCRPLRAFTLCASCKSV